MRIVKCVGGFFKLRKIITDHFPHFFSSSHFAYNKGGCIIWAFFGTMCLFLKCRWIWWESEEDQKEYAWCFVFNSCSVEAFLCDTHSHKQTNKHAISLFPNKQAKNLKFSARFLSQPFSTHYNKSANNMHTHVRVTWITLINFISFYFRSYVSLKMYMSEFCESITKSLEIQSNANNFHCIVSPCAKGGEGCAAEKNDLFV